MEEETHNELNIFQILNISLNIYRNHLQDFLKIGLLYGIANVIDTGVNKIFGDPGMAWALLINIFISAIGIILICDTCRRIHNNKQPDLKKSFSIATGIIPTVYAIHLTITLLFILPILFIETLGIISILFGLYASTVFIFAEMIAVIERKQYINCFKTSMDMVKGKFFKVLAFNIVFVILIVFPLLILKSMSVSIPIIARVLNVLFVVTLPVFQGIAQTELYYHIKKQSCTNQHC